MDVVELYRHQNRALEALRDNGIRPLKPLKFWIDVENCKATIPGEGNIKLAYTASRIALDVDVEWPKTLKIVGTNNTHNELVEIAEKVRGQSFEVVYKDRDQLTKELVPNPPSQYVNLTNQLSLAILDGRFTFESNFDCGDFEFTQPASFMEKWWPRVDT
ncbi:hypothetical protein B0H11DRAFT_1970223 [Mycena galericulata]|nr:hypothetical protein B0H11DRAFT_1970223 [Mycena galericulata]